MKIADLQYAVVSVGRDKQAHAHQQHENGSDDNDPSHGVHGSDMGSDSMIFHPEPGTDRADPTLSNRRFPTDCLSVGDALKRLFGLHRKADGDLSRAIENFKNVIAQQTVKFAHGALAGGKFNAPIAGTAIGTNDIGLFHVATRAVVSFLHSARL